MTDPKVRRDGKCAVCRKPIDVSPRPGLNPSLYVDPFCSRTCCEKYHGTE